MRSQLFGFTCQTQLVYELNLACPFSQAHELTVQHMSKLEGSGYDLCQQHASIFTLGYKYALTVEGWLNEWEPEVLSTVSTILQQYRPIDEMQVMQLLKEALSWRWLRIKEMAALAQFHLAVTVEQTTHLTLAIGWNGGATAQTISHSRDFARPYFQQFENLGIACQWNALYPREATEPDKHQYGARLDTLGKLRDLSEKREKLKKAGKLISSVRTDVIKDTFLAPATVKKYDQLLYDRWYDPDY